MATNEELRSFVKDGLARGVPRRSYRRARRCARSGGLVGK